LIVADRIDRIGEWLRQNGFQDQFHPSYTRMVPAHHVVQIELIGCPDPDPVCERFFEPPRNAFSTDLDELGRNYIAALSQESNAGSPAFLSQNQSGSASLAESIAGPCFWLLITVFCKWE